MTHPIYSTANLEALTINRLKEIAAQLGIKPATDARLKQSWVMAIVNHQARTIELVDSLPDIPLPSDIIPNPTQPLAEGEEEEMVPLPPSVAPQPLIPILAIVVVILALSIAIVPLALLLSIPLVFRRSSSSSAIIPKISS